MRYWLLVATVVIYLAACGPPVTRGTLVTCMRDGGLAYHGVVRIQREYSGGTVTRGIVIQGVTLDGAVVTLRCDVLRTQPWTRAQAR